MNLSCSRTRLARKDFWQALCQEKRQTKLIEQAEDGSIKVYGCRKLHDDLRDLGEDIRPNRAWRLTRLAGLSDQISYKKKSCS